MYCMVKPAKIGKAQGYKCNRFCTAKCVLKAALGNTVDSHWCSKCQAWWEGKCPVCDKGED